MFTIRRTTTTPNSVLRCVVTGSTGAVEAVLRFAPAGQEGDTHPVSRTIAEGLMNDAGLAEHFDCQPPLKEPERPAEPEPPAKPARRSRGRGRK